MKGFLFFGASFAFEIFLFPLVSSQEQQCSAVLQKGTVIGSVADTLNPNKKICAYLGIPYARPPTGIHRFKAPEPADAWKTLNATSWPNWCPQAGTPPSGTKMSEDCLQLNVYQPISDKPDPTGFPVMIWFHGGSFTSGSSDLYKPTRLLAKEDVIIVVVHYRLGVLGFFSTGDDVVPGNNGLKDQAFSIRWVKDNIKAFGGNPNKITIFGESAGGSSVMYQYISPLNKGLLHGAIAQSGSALSFWSIDKNPSESSKIIGKQLGCPTLTKRLMVDCMKLLPWQLIVLKQSLFSLQSLKEFNYPSAGLTPVVEPKLPGAFISDEPLKIMKEGEIPDIPVMIGANEHEGTFVLGGMYLAKFGPEKLDKDVNYMRYQIVPDILKFANIHEDPGNRIAASSVELAFLSGVNRSSWEESVSGIVNALTVFGYKAPLQHTADILSSRNKTVYVYSMEYHSNNSLFSFYFKDNVKNIPIKHGVTHGDELLYLFDLPAKFSTSDQDFSDLMSNMWLNFGKNGNPTPPEAKQKVKWLPYDVKDEAYLKLDSSPTMQHGYRNSWRSSGFE